MKTLTAVVLAAMSCCAFGQTYDTNNVVVQTFAGSGFEGYLDGQGTQTIFYKPSEVVADSLGNLFVLQGIAIRKITPDGTVSTFAGPESLPSDVSWPSDGTKVLSLPVDSLYSITIGHSNDLWFTGSSRVGFPLWRIGANREVSTPTIVSRPSFAGEPSGGGICVDSKNNVYYPGSERIFRLRTDGVIEAFVGSGNTGSVDGNGIFTSFNMPRALAADAADNIYVWDSKNHLIRRINQNRDVVTIAGKLGVALDSDGVGTNASFNFVGAMTVDGSGNLILACGWSIRKMTATGNVLTIAGSFAQSGYANGTGAVARFSGASGLCLSRGMIFVADSGNHRIRSITFDAKPELVSSPSLSLNLYPGVHIAGTVGRSYRVESSTDMNTWREETKLLLTSSPYLWIDQSGVGTKRFYRAFLLP